MIETCFNLHVNWFLKFRSCRRVHSQGVDEGVIEGNEAVPREEDGTMAIKKSPKDACCNRGYAIEEHAAEKESDNPTRSLQSVPDKGIEEQRPSTSADLHVIANHAPANLENVRNIDELKPTTSKTLEGEEVESDSADDVVVLGSQPVPEGEKEDGAAADRSDETHSDGPVQQDKIDEDFAGNVVVV